MLCLLSGGIRIEGELVGARPEIVDVVPSLPLTDTDERLGRDHLATTTQVRDHLATTTQVRDHLATTMFKVKLIMLKLCRPLQLVSFFP